MILTTTDRANPRTFVEEEKLKSVFASITSGALREAARELNRLQLEGGSDPRIYWLGGYLAASAGNHANALVSLKRCVELAPTWIEAHRAISRSFAALGMNREAALAVYKSYELSDRTLRSGIEALELLAKANEHRLVEKLAETLLNEAVDAPSKLQIHLVQMVSRRVSGNFDGAHASAVTCLKIDEECAPAHVVVAENYQLKNDLEMAKTHYQRALEINPSDNRAADMLAAITSGTLPELDERSTADTFDNYAERFEDELLNRLKYQAHRQVAEKLKSRLTKHTSVDLLDLGCGTGLLGEELRGLSGTKVGVDLSANMLRKCGARAAYDRLYECSIADALRETPADFYDAIAASDVFVYIAELKGIFEGCYKLLRPRGVLVFTVEAGIASDGATPALDLLTMRYRHPNSYLDQQLRLAHFSSIEIIPIVSRENAGVPVECLLVSARKS